MVFHKNNFHFHYNKVELYVVIFRLAYSYWKVFFYIMVLILYCPYSPVFESLRIQSKYRKIRIRKNSVLGHFSYSAKITKSNMPTFFQIIVNCKKIHL